MPLPTPLLPNLEGASLDTPTISGNEGGASFQAVRRKLETMSYYFGKILDVPFDEAVTKIVEALKKEGVGVLTQIVPS